MVSKSPFVKQFERIYEISARINSSLELPVVLENIVEGLAETELTSRANLYLVDEAQQEIYNVAAVGLSEEFLRAAGRIPLGGGSCGLAAQEGEVVVVEDVETSRLCAPHLEVARKEKIRATWCVPLIDKNGKSIGALSTFYEEPFRPTAEQIRMAELYANCAAIAIENACLYSSSQSIIAKFSNLQTAARQMTSTLKIDEVLEDICRLSAEAMGAEKAWVGLLEVGSSRVQPAAGYGYSIDCLKSVTITYDDTPHGSGPSGKALKTKQPVIIGDIPSDPTFEPWRELAREEGDSSMASLPLVCHGNPVGVLNLYSRRKNAFSENDLSVLMAFASQAAIAIDNARSYESSRRREKRLVVLHDMSKALSPMLDFDELCWTVYEEVKRALNADSFYISLYVPDDHSINVCFMVDEGKRYSPHTYYLKTHPVLERIMFQRKSVLVNRTDESVEAMQKDEQEAELAATGNTERRSASLMFAPMCVGEKVVGAISVQSYSVGAYSNEHLELLTAIANQAAIAIEDAQLEAKYRTLIENANDVVYVHDLEGNFLLGNKKFEEATGYSREEMPGLNIADILPESWLEAAKTRIKEKVSAGGAAQPSEPYEAEITTKDGRLLPIELTSSPIIRGGKVVAIQGIARDVSERKRMEAQLKQRTEDLEDRNRRLKSIYELGITLTGDVTEVFNRIVETIASVLDVKIASVHELIDGDFVSLLTRIGDKTYSDDRFPVKGTPCEDVIRLGQLRVSGEVAEKYPDDAFLRKHDLKSYAGVPVLDSSGDAAAVLCAIDDEERDFSDEDMSLLFTFSQRAGSEIERRRGLKEHELLRQRLVHADKMASIGRMIAGVAHELNNPLQGVLGYSELLRSSGKLDSEAMEMLSRVSTQAHRCKDIVLKLMKFSRRERLEKGTANVNDLLAEVVKLRRFDFEKHNMMIIEKYDRQLPYSLVDPREIQSVFMCIMDNAFDAMRETSGPGKLTVRTSRLKANLEVELSNIRPYPVRQSSSAGRASEDIPHEDQEGEGAQSQRQSSSKDEGTQRQWTERDCVKIEFNDSGGGIAEPDKVFDPFYTTKEVGEGTGLGLSLSYGIIAEHCGRITASNNDGGAVFTIILPTVETAKGLKQTGRIREAEPFSGRGYSALVVDDEEIIIGLMKRILEKSGYDVDGCLRGEDAIERLKLRDYDVIITDIVMPGMDGKRLFRWVKENKPEMIDRIVFSTADVFSDDTRAFLEEVNRPAIPKPFSIENFRDVVSRVTRGTL